MYVWHLSKYLHINVLRDLFFRADFAVWLIDGTYKHGGGCLSEALRKCMTWMAMSEKELK